MRQAICKYAERAAEKVPSERQFCREISVFIRISPHAENEIYYGSQAIGKLLTPFNDTRDIIRVAMEILDRICLDSLRYIKAGIMLSDFFSQRVALLNLFGDHKPQANREALMRVIDCLNQSGKGKL